MLRQPRVLSWLVLALTAAVGGAAARETTVHAAELWIGAATADITPTPPVVLEGLQVVRAIHSPLAASVLAIESREGERVIDQAILIACDLCILPGVQDGFRQHMAGRLAGFDLRKLFLTATHTHSSPEVVPKRHVGKEYDGAMQAEQYLPFLYERMGAAAVKAWQGRAAGAVAWGLGHAVAGRGRRTVYADGSAQMYGNTNHPQFSHVEGHEDHAVDILCFYDAKRQLQAMAITLACPSQTIYGTISADFWHEVRQRLRQQHGRDLCVVGCCAPAGDQSPLPLYGNKAETRMDQLRGLDRTQELGRRVAEAAEDVASVIAKDMRSEAPMAHLVRQLDLPARLVTDAECAIAKKVCDGIDAKKTPNRGDRYWRRYYGLIVERYLAQQKGERVLPIEIHVLRLGDVAVATNPFELYHDYAVRIQARSPAEQTILIQLASAPQDYVGYLPTERAVAAGGLKESPMNNYSATVLTNLVGPEGGQALVEQTLAAINELWKK